jgi:hypothetical protein
MLRKVMLLIGVLCVLGVIGASGTMNFLFGYGFGTTVEAARVWAGLSVASDGLKAVLPVVVAQQVAQRHWGRALAGMLIFPLVLGYGFMSALGFASQNRAVLVAGAAKATAVFDQAGKDLEAAQADLKRIGPQRMPAEVQVALGTLKREGLWSATRSCTRAKVDAARDFCRKADGLVTEGLLAEQRVGLEAKVETLKAKLGEARPVQAAQLGDLQAEALEWLFGDAGRAGKGLSWLAATLVEVISAFGLLVVDQARKKPKEVAQEAPWELVGEVEA